MDFYLPRISVGCAGNARLLKINIENGAYRAFELNAFSGMNWPARSIRSSIRISLPIHTAFGVNLNSKGDSIEKQAISI